MKAKLKQIAGRIRSPERPVYCVRASGRRTPTVVSAGSKAEAIKKALKRMRRVGDEIADAWRLTNPDSLAKARRGEWIRDYDATGRPAPRSVPGFGPPLKKD